MSIYYDPTTIGLETVGEIEWSEPCYDFELTAVWKDKDGKLYWASDSGCSCPSPFEDFNTIESLDTGTFFELAKELTERAQGNQHAEPQVFDLLARLR